MTILYGSGISNSTRHSGDNLPLLVVGGGAGRLKGGRHLTYSDKPTMANLLVTLMDKLDVPVERLGGSTGRLPLDTLVRASEHVRMIAVRRHDCTDRGWQSFCLWPPLAAIGAPLIEAAQKRRQGGLARAAPEARRTSTPPKRMARRRFIGRATATISKAPIC